MGGAFYRWGRICGLSIGGFLYEGAIYRKTPRGASHIGGITYMPRAPKQCAYKGGCIERVIGRPYCAVHTRAWEGSHSPSSTRAHRTLRIQVLSEEPVCMDCHVNPSTEVGHIVPAYRGGKYMRSNLKGQCRPCNLAQIQQDRVRYGR